MTVVLEADTRQQVLGLPASGERADPADVLREIIAAHREALRALAPHQEEHRGRVQAAWHIAELGLLLRVRDGAGLETEAEAEQTKAPTGVTQHPQGPGENSRTDHGTH